VLHISIWGIEAFSGRLSSDGTEFWASCGSVPPPIGGMECGWYGSGCGRSQNSTGINWIPI